MAARTNVRALKGALASGSKPRGGGRTPAGYLPRVQGSTGPMSVAAPGVASNMGAHAGGKTTVNSRPR